MNLEEAIQTAIQYETRVHELYAGAATEAQDDMARRVLTVLADEERGHLDYLQSRLTEWQTTGSITDAELGSAIPNSEDIAKGLDELKARIEPKERGPEVDAELALLQRALEVEAETSNFYARMVKELEGDGQRLFKRFLEIEQGHQSIVQAEIDSVSGLGFWFDTQEFGLERG